jgi:hypothetical protein
MVMSMVEGSAAPLSARARDSIGHRLERATFADACVIT